MLACPVILCRLLAVQYSTAAATSCGDMLGRQACRPRGLPDEHPVRPNHEVLEGDYVDEVLLLQLTHQVQGSGGLNGSAAPARAPLQVADAPWEDSDQRGVLAVATPAPGRLLQPAQHLGGPVRHGRVGSIPRARSAGSEVQLALMDLTSSTQGATLIVLVLLGCILVLLIAMVMIAPYLSGSSDQEEPKPRPRRPPSSEPAPPLPRPAPEQSPDTGTASSLLQSVPTLPVVTDIPLIMPPPLCEKLIMENAPVRFCIAYDQFEGAITGSSSSNTSQMDITSPSGKKLLQLSLDKTWSGSKTLAISSIGAEDDPRAVIANATFLSSSFRIFGRMGALYGNLEVGSSGGHVLHSGKQVMALEYGDKELMAMTALAMGGQQLAFGSLQEVAGEGTAGRKIWQLKACPGCDAVLVTACMVTMLLRL
mmetsp:Transcript_133144/g.413999  ORF Transcript_133144/g.413999 Transcript_133144/m.413999 type:complete len:423 (+) Transcript_133144:93-1361(+)